MQMDLFIWAMLLATVFLQIYNTDMSVQEDEVY